MKVLIDKSRVIVKNINIDRLMLLERLFIIYFRLALVLAEINEDL